jgi:inner membrane protein
MLQSIRASRLLRILLLGFLVLLLQIPVLMIHGQISNRSQTRDEAVSSVTRGWGEEQTIVGPVLVVPYVRRWTEEGKSGESRTRTSSHEATFLPETLDVSGRLETEVRNRGIFRVPVYRASLDLKGRFRRPDFSSWGVVDENIRWDRAVVWVKVADARAIKNQATLTWNGNAIPFEPGTAGVAGDTPGIHAPLRGRAQASAFEFSFSLSANGSEGMSFAPLGQQTTVRLESNWGEPSFQGNWLPAERKLSHDGFEASWDISYLGRNYPQRWTSESPFLDKIEASEFGVRLVTPIDPYRMAERSVKYEALFIMLTFVALWLFEVVVRRKVHSVQYLMVGAGMCLFYLLELSLAEHLGFTAAYALASLAVVSLITAYSVAVLKGARRASVIGAVLAALYGYLYILLKNQDYALLIGSVGLFLILALVMYLTRKVDWNEARG